MNKLNDLSKMTKNLVILALMTMILGLCSCGSSTSTEEASTTSMPTKVSTDAI